MHSPLTEIKEKIKKIAFLELIDINLFGNEDHLFFENLLWIRFCTGVCYRKGKNVLLFLLVHINIVALCESGGVLEAVIDSSLVNLILTWKFGS